MAQVIIYGVAAGTSADQVKQKLAGHYKCSEDRFEVVAHSLVVKNQPFVFMNEIEQAQAEIHKRGLTKLGFTCEKEETPAEEKIDLSLDPVGDFVDAYVECPACEKSSGGGDICQHCDVVISKYLEHKKVDDELQRHIHSSSYSAERMKEIQAAKKSVR